MVAEVRPERPSSSGPNTIRPGAGPLIYGAPNGLLCHFAGSRDIVAYAIKPDHANVKRCACGNRDPSAPVDRRAERPLLISLRSRCVLLLWMRSRAMHQVRLRPRGFVRLDRLIVLREDRIAQ